MTVTPTTGDAAVGSSEDILRRAGGIPPRTGFPTVDALLAALEELRARHPDLIRVRRIGTSRLGEPIPLYTVADGARSMLVVGGVHPNEPIGSWTILHLVEELATDEGLRRGLDATWHIIPCADPDGMRLNEAWFAEPADRGEYARRFYRPAPDEQVEWTFPFHYKKAYFDAMLPETQALARAIDETRPQLYVPLHNSESGGAYYYLSRPAPELYPLLHAVPEHLGVPLDRGEPESAHFTVLAPAVFESGTLEAAYDWSEQLGLDPYPPGSGGDASSSYAARHGTLSLIAELPYWSHPAADDTTPTASRYADVLVAAGDRLVAAGTALGTLLARADPHLRLDTPMLRASRAFVPMVEAVGRGNLARAATPDADRPATVAETFGCGETVHMYRLRYGGMLLRAFEAEAAAGTASAELRRIAAETAELFDAWRADAAEDGTEPLPVAALVGVQYGAILAACTRLDRS